MISIEFLRQFRILDYAIFDFVVSFLGVYLLASLLSKLFLKIRLDIPKRNWLWLTIPIGTLTHIFVGTITPIFVGTITPMTRDMLDIHGHYILKLIMLVLLFFGLRGIKIVKK